MKRRASGRAYVDGFESVGSVFELDDATAREIADALDPHREDALITPWRRGLDAAIRAASRG